MTILQVPLIRFFGRKGLYGIHSMKIRFLASPIVAAFFVLNCWAQNAHASTPPPNSLLERLTTLTDTDPRPWTAEQFATMERIRDAAMTDPNAYNMLAHLTDNI